MLPLAWIMVLRGFQVGLYLCVILKRTLWEPKGPSTVASFRRSTPWIGVDRSAATYPLQANHVGAIVIGRIISGRMHF